MSVEDAATTAGQAADVLLATNNPTIAALVISNAIFIVFIIVLWRAFVRGTEMLNEHQVNTIATLEGLKLLIQTMAQQRGQ